MANNHIDAHSENERDLHQEHHVVSIPLYLMVFGVLIVGTILTVVVAFVDQTKSGIRNQVIPGARIV